MNKPIYDVPGPYEGQIKANAVQSVRSCADCKDCLDVHLLENGNVLVVGSEQHIEMTVADFEGLKSITL
jgi:hypothetical protein